MAARMSIGRTPVWLRSEPMPGGPGTGVKIKVYEPPGREEHAHRFAKMANKPLQHVKHSFLSLRCSLRCAE